MNEVEQYLAKAAGREAVVVGQDISIRVDLVVAHDVTGPLALEPFNKIGVDKVFDSNKVAFFLDHVFPASTVQSRDNHNMLLAFARRYGVKIFNKGEGVIHQLIAEEFNLPRGAIIVGADSHTCTAGGYGVLAFGVGSTEFAAAMATGMLDIEVPAFTYIRLDGEIKPGVSAKDIALYLIGKFGTEGFTDQGILFGGSWVEKSSIDERMTISNMTIEMGAMLSYFSESSNVGEVSKTIVIDVSTIDNMVSCPPSPGNVKPLGELLGTPITQVVIGSCTNGRFSDMQAAAKVLAQSPVHPNVTCIVLPASRKVSEAMEQAGLTTIFRRAGAVVTNPGCGPCFGGHLGLITADDTVASTTNRNFPGRMGAKEGKIYLVSPQIAAEAAVSGRLVASGTVARLKEVCEGE